MAQKDRFCYREQTCAPRTPADPARRRRTSQLCLSPALAPSQAYREPPPPAENTVVFEFRFHFKPEPVLVNVRFSSRSGADNGVYLRTQRKAYVS